MPVTVRREDGSLGATFANVYCLLCNWNRSEPLPEVAPWNTRIANLILNTNETVNEAYHANKENNSYLEWDDYGVDDSFDSIQVVLLDPPDDFFSELSLKSSEREESPCFLPRTRRNSTCGSLLIPVCIYFPLERNSE